MHAGAFEFVGQYATRDALTVIEVGSRDINGSIRCHFPAATWTGLDLHSGPSVDIIADALDYTPADRVDLVLICEVMEHCPRWQEMVHHVASWLRPGGRIIITCAGPGRDPHSAIDGGPLQLNEHYANVTQDDLAEELHYAGFVQIEVSGNEHWKDTYAIAERPS